MGKIVAAIAVAAVLGAILAQASKPKAANR